MPNHTESEVPRRKPYSVKGLAADLGVASSTVYGAIQRGEIAVIQIGDRLLIPPA